MNQTLETGETVRFCDDSDTCRVGNFLGGGGQGEVYQAKWKGKEYAVKWYFSHMATKEQHASLETLVRIGSPDERYLWPLKVSPFTHGKSFGYVMELRPLEYKSIIDLMKRRAEPSFRSLVTAGFQLADSFLELHSKGLCYRDISFGNVFINPDNGDVLICDNDNVGVESETPTGVLGTPRFMAPEIVRGEAKPGADSDLFSLAVLLFYMLYLHHPLEGAKEEAIKCFDLPAMNKLYGTDPLYIFHPTDTSNRPVDGLHDNATTYHKIYPQFIRDLFERTFTTGIKDITHGRTRESEWRNALTKLQDSIVYCSQCGAENFHDSEASSPGECWHCKKKVRLPMHLVLGRSVVMLNYDAKLFHHHVDDEKKFDFSEVVAEVTQHPNNPSLWGLKNLTGDSWNVKFADGSVKSVPPRKNAPLSPGNEIQFGKTEGIVQSDEGQS